MIIPEPQARQIARQRRVEAEQAAAAHRLHRQIGGHHSWRTQLGRLLISLGERLSPAPTHRPVGQPA